jgi:hypothetical protein
MSRDSNSPLVAMTMIDEVKNTINKGKLWLLSSYLPGTNWVFSFSRNSMTVLRSGSFLCSAEKLELFPAAGSELSRDPISAAVVSIAAT